MPCQCYTREPLSKLERTSPHVKINVTSKSPVGDISVVTLIRTDTTLDHSQKAEKVWILIDLILSCIRHHILNGVFFRRSRYESDGYDQLRLEVDIVKEFPHCIMATIPANFTCD